MTLKWYGHLSHVMPVEKCQSRIQGKKKCAISLIQPAPNQLIMINTQD